MKNKRNVIKVVNFHWAQRRFISEANQSTWSRLLTGYIGSGMGSMYQHHVNVIALWQSFESDSARYVQDRHISQGTKAQATSASWYSSTRASKAQEIHSSLCSIHGLLCVCMCSRLCACLPSIREDMCSNLNQRVWVVFVRASFSATNHHERPHIDQYFWVCLLSKRLPRTLLACFDRTACSSTFKWA